MMAFVSLMATIVTLNLGKFPEIESLSKSKSSNPNGSDKWS